MSASERPHHILLLEDDLGLRTLIQRRLERSGLSLTCVGTAREALAYLAVERVELLLIDYELPDMDASHLLDALHRVGRGKHFIVISGRGDTETAVSMMKRGAMDFLVKDQVFLDLLPEAVSRALEQIETARRLEAAEEALRCSEERYRLLVENAHDGIFQMVGDRFRYANPALLEMLGYDLETFLRLSFADILSSETPGYERILRYLTRREEEPLPLQPFEARLKTREGKLRDVILDVSLAAMGEETGESFIVTDITERKRMLEEKAILEQQLHQAEKLEAIGRLAGGIAHDFNNLLSGIMGFADLLRLKLQHDPQLARYAEAIKATSEQAAQIVGKLLTFARKSDYQLAPVEMHRLIGELVTLLEHTFDPRIRILCDLAAERSVVLGDANHLQNAILNLAVNARDAMPQGGELRLISRIAALDEAFCRSHPGLVPGDYWQLDVVDTGEGIDPSIQPYIFDPFFTTKGIGKGTGIGLASVYGCITGHGGYLDFTSERGKGATFRLFLPLHGETPPSSPREGIPVSGHGRILVLDDEPVVVEMLLSMLKGLGYEVVVFQEPEKAIAFYQEHHSQIDLLLLDMVMPQMDGRETFHRMKAINPNLRVILMTGYTTHAAVEELRKEGLIDVIMKPFSMVPLSRTIAKALGTAVLSP